MGVEIPETRYARSGDISIAYQVVGEGPFDLVLVPPMGSHVELVWELPLRAGLNRALAEFSRLVIFDKRGTGLSDPVDRQATIEERMDDVRAVLDAVGSAQAGVFAIGDGCLTASLFVATYPERCFGLVLWSPFARSLWAPDYPFGETREEAEREIREIESSWGTQEYADRVLQPLYGGDPPDDMRRGFARFLRNSASPRGAAEFARSIYDTDIRGVLPLIAVPSLVLHRAVPEQADAARDVAARIPGAVLQSFHGAGVPWPDDERGRPVVDALRAFLQDAWERRVDAVPDRVLTTVLFTDIVDSTAKAVELGDARWRELVAEHHRRVRLELARFRGRELDTAGDGFFASFDGPARAIGCACAVRDAVAGIGVEIRAGLHTGECEQLDGKVAGIAVVTGARIAGLGGPSDVLVSATVRDLVAGSGLAFEDRGVHELKGLPEARQVFAVV